MAHKLAGYVSIDGRQWGPEDDVPDDVAARITNPKAWPDGKVPAVAGGTPARKPAERTSK